MTKSPKRASSMLFTAVLLVLVLPLAGAQTDGATTPSTAGCIPGSEPGGTCHGNGICSGVSCACNAGWTNYSLPPNPPGCPAPDTDNPTPSPAGCCPYSFDQTGCCFKEATPGCHASAKHMFIKIGAGLATVALGMGLIKLMKHKSTVKLEDPPLITTDNGYPVDAPFDAGFLGKVLRDKLHIPIQNWHFGVLHLFQHVAGKYFMIMSLGTGKGSFTYYTAPGEDGQAYGIDCTCAQFDANGKSMAPTDWWYQVPGSYATENQGLSTPQSCGTLTQLCYYSEPLGTGGVIAGVGIAVVIEIIFGIYLFRKRENFPGAWFTKDLWLAIKGTQLVKKNQAPRSQGKPTPQDFGMVLLTNFAPSFAAFFAIAGSWEAVSSAQKFVTPCDKVSIVITIVLFFALGGWHGAILFFQAGYIAILSAVCSSGDKNQEDAVAAFFCEETWCQGGLTKKKEGGGGGFSVAELEAKRKAKEGRNPMRDPLLIDNPADGHTGSSSNSSNCGGGTAGPGKVVIATLPALVRQGQHVEEEESRATKELVAVLMKSKKLKTCTLAEAKGAIHAVGLDKHAARDFIVAARHEEQEQCGLGNTVDDTTSKLKSRFCGNCGTKDASGARFCTQCATPFAAAVTDARFCGTCGTKDASGMARFCTNCATSF
jgi:hypothetical protein